MQFFCMGDGATFSDRWEFCFVFNTRPILSGATTSQGHKWQLKVTQINRDLDFALGFTCMVTW